MANEAIIVSYMGGTIKFNPAGEGIVNGVQRKWDRSVKFFGKGNPVGVSVESIKALLEAVEDREDVRIFLNGHA